MVKKVESLFENEGNNYIIRLFNTQPLIDDKWIQDIERTKLKKYLIVKYLKEFDKWLPIWNKNNFNKVQWWDGNTHAELKNNIINYNENWNRELKDKEKINEARKQFMKTKFTYFHAENFNEAKDKYSEWLKEDGKIISELTISNI